VGVERRRSVVRCRHRRRPKPLPSLSRRPSTEADERAQHTRFIQRQASKDFCQLDQTVRSKSRVAPAHTTAKQPLRARRAACPKTCRPRRVLRLTEVKLDPQQRHQIHRVAPSLTERGNRPDAPHAVCLLLHPKDRQQRKPPAARVQRHLPWGSVPFSEISQGDRWHAGLPDRRLPLSGFLTLSAV
jgi:hypothetical protein